jgi:RNA polymerase sigma-70 factor (ECF subfamily)
MKHRQIAEVMGMPLPTVLSKYSRAMKKLRNRLQGDDL